MGSVGEKLWKNPGGGLGNIIDRIFRTSRILDPDTGIKRVIGGVVDFIDVRFFGIANSPIPLFRWPRWPTFNIADSAVVVCCIILFVTILISPIKDRQKPRK